MGGRRYYPESCYEYIAALMQKKIKTVWDVKHYPISAETACALARQFQLSTDERSQILFAATLMGADFYRLDELLREGGFGKIDVRLRNDAIWAYVLFHHIDTEKLLDLLKEKAVV